MDLNAGNWIDLSSVRKKKPQRFAEDRFVWMTSDLSERSCGARFCLGCRDRSVVQATLLVWRSVASWFGLGS
ncbi:hypothetical protein SynA1560_01637 [Synechococcus sp. A15-60]|nr:hypothetical protein SynA1560_01637 [Synechococcus sp. A15-60]